MCSMKLVVTVLNITCISSKKQPLRFISGAANFHLDELRKAQINSLNGNVKIHNGQRRKDRNGEIRSNVTPRDNAGRLGHRPDVTRKQSVCFTSWVGFLLTVINAVPSVSLSPCRGPILRSKPESKV